MVVSRGGIAMALTNSGWEMQIIRKSVQTRSSGRARVRTVGTYQIFHEGVAQTGFAMKGTVAESPGPGDNAVAGNKKRVEAGNYPISTQDGEKYKTFGYTNSEAPNVGPKPGIELNKTGRRSEILIHPGQAFLASVGCINPCTSLPNAAEMIDYAPSRKRVIAIIEDLRAFLGSDFPTRNGRKIPRAQIVIEGEP
jgi:hypothetical protein